MSSLFELVCEPGGEVYSIKNLKVLRRFYGKRIDIFPTSAIIENFFNHFNNYSISLNDILEIIHSPAVINNYKNDISSYNKIFNKVFLPKISVYNSIGLL